jgi:3-deoxy-D-manno-octulosonic-acid transferase
VIVETDIWPNFLAETARRGVPVFLANARLSKRSLSGYRRAAFFIRPVFQCFAKICCQSALDADRFQRLGLPLELIPVTGSIKFDQTRESFPKSRLEEIRKTAGIPAGRKVMVAGSTHEGEEAVLAEALTLLKREFPDLCLIAAPRDPLRARAVRQVFQQAGFSGVLMSEPERCSDPDVIIIDRIGVLNGLYAFADAAFVGGSLIRLGGHNPLEPAAWGRPILFGPYMSDFVEISHLLLESGGAEEVTDASSLYGAVKAILMGREKAEHMGSQALRVFQANKGAVERTVGIIQDYLRQDYLRQDYLRK